MDDDTLEAKLKEQVVYWQKVLYLQDWTVELRVCRLWEMSDSNTLAECHWFLQRKDAIIKVIHQNDLGSMTNRFIAGEEADYDVSIVHELLHLHFANFHNESDEVFHSQ